MAPAPASPTTAKRSSPAPSSTRWVKIIIGCTALVGLLFACAIVSIWGLGFYLMSTPEQLAAEALMGPETVGIVRFDGSRPDPGTEALLERLFDAFYTQPHRSNLPPSLQWWFDINARQQRGQLKKMAPREVAVLLERRPGDETPDTVWLVAPGMLPRIYETFLGFFFSQAPPGSSQQYRGHTILDLGPDGKVTLVQGTVLVGSSADALHRVLDRIDTPASNPLTDELAGLGGDGQIIVDWEEAAALVTLPFDASNCEQLRGSFDLVDAETLEFEAVTTCSEPGAAAAAAEAIDRWLTDVESGMPAPLGLSHRFEATPPTVEILGELTGVASWFESKLAARPTSPVPTPPATP